MEQYNQNDFAELKKFYNENILTLNGNESIFNDLLNWASYDSSIGTNPLSVFYKAEQTVEGKRQIILNYVTTLLNTIRQVSKSSNKPSFRIDFPVSKDSISPVSPITIHHGEIAEMFKKPENQLDTLITQSIGVTNLTVKLYQIISKRLQMEAQLPLFTVELTYTTNVKPLAPAEFNTEV